MSKQKNTDPIVQIDVEAWVERAKDAPATYLQRQAAEITLNTIAMTSPLNEQLVLKGGVLMGIAYDSPRQTSDIDLSAALVVDDEIDKKIVEMLDESFPRAAAKLGYTELILRVHSVKKMPRPEKFQEMRFPALKIKVGYAERNTKQAKALLAGKAVNSMFEIDISFNEPMQYTQILSLTGGENLLAYDLADLMAEKLRAMLQQVKRNRARRQDVYDLHILISREKIDDALKAKVLDSFLIKSHSRDIDPKINSLDDPELKERSKKNWSTMALEIGDLPDFEETYETVRQFYRGLPWK